MAILIAATQQALGQVTFELNSSRLQVPAAFAKTSDQGFIIGGNMLDTASAIHDNYALVKIDSSLNETWAAFYSNMVYDGYITSLFQSFDGNYYFSGYPSDFSIHNTILAKISPNGTPIWCRSFNLPGMESNTRSQCIETSDHNVVLSVNQQSFYSSLVSLIKLDSNGNTIWENTYSNLTQLIGACNSLIQTNDLGYMIAGESPSFGCYLLKTDSIGNPQWFKQYGNAWLPGRSVLQIGDGGYIVTCGRLPWTNGDAMIFRTDSAGDTLWTKHLSGPEYHFLNSMISTTDGNFVIAGAVGNSNNQTQRLLLVKINLNGDTLWTRTYQAPNVNLTGMKVNEAPDNGLEVLCQSLITSLLIKTDSSGNYGCNQSLSVTNIQNASITVISDSIWADPTQAQAIELFGYEFYPPSSLITCISTEIENLHTSSNDFTIHPNPSSGWLKVECSQAIAELSIFNSMGYPMLEASWRPELDIRELPPGLYFLRIQTGHQMVIKRFIKE